LPGKLIGTFFKIDEVEALHARRSGECKIVLQEDSRHAEGESHPQSFAASSSGSDHVLRREKGDKEGQGAPIMVFKHWLTCIEEKLGPEHRFAGDINQRIAW
jgi:hypothetical protein